MSEYKMRSRLFTGNVMKVDSKSAFGSGKRIVTIMANDGRETIAITLWEDVADDFIKQNLAGKRVTFHGLMSTAETMKGSMFYEFARPKIIEVTAKEKVEMAEKRYKRGFREVTIDVDDKTIFTEMYKDHCSNLNGEWVAKIEYVMNGLGAKVVTERLRKFKDDGSPGGVNVDPKVYKPLLEEMVMELAEKTGDKIYQDF